MSLRLPERFKQTGLAALAGLGLLFPQALPIVLGLLLLVMAAEAWGAGGWRGLRMPGAVRRLRWAGVAFLFPLLALALSPWAEWPGPAVARAGRLIVELSAGLGLAAFLLGFDGATAQRRGRAVCLGLAMGAAGAVLDLVSQGGLTGWLRGQPVDTITYGRSAVLAALVTVPMLLAARFPLWQRFALALPAVVLALISANLAAKLILPAALAAAVIGIWRLGPLLLAGLVSLALLLPALLPVGLTPAEDCALWAGKPSAAHRLLIWTYADGLIDQRPWTGWGLDAARRLGAVAPEAPVPVCAQLALGRDTVPLLPLHPHNGALQLWLELGVGGALLLPLLLMVLVRPLATRAKVDRMTGSAAFTGASVPLLVSFGLWQGWWLAALALFWGLILLFSARRS